MFWSKLSQGKCSNFCSTYNMSLVFTCIIHLVQRYILNLFIRIFFADYCWMTWSGAVLTNDWDESNKSKVLTINNSYIKESFKVFPQSGFYLKAYASIYVCEGLLLFVFHKFWVLDKQTWLCPSLNRSFHTFCWLASHKRKWTVHLVLDKGRVFSLKFFLVHGLLFLFLSLSRWAFSNCISIKTVCSLFNFFGFPCIYM